MTFSLESNPILQSPSAPVSVDTDQPVLFFEGPEKTLEVEFQGAAGCSLRLAGRQAWDEVVKKAAATILDHISNEHFDSYILSESSLFVTDDKVIIKTCGTTTLLHTLSTLRDVAESVGMKMGFSTFTRKDLQRPGKQIHPHQSFDDEMLYFSNFFGTSSGDVFGQVLGPVSSDRWHLCTSPTAFPAFMHQQPANLTTCTINMMMYGMSPEAARKFCKSDEHSSGVDMTDKTGIRALLPSSTVIHEFAFDPCGYSMNALCGSGYATVHVTPESSCSYASFETTIAPWTDTNVASVLDVFLPSRFTITRASQAKCDCNHCDFPAMFADSTGRAFYRSIVQHTTVASREYVMANYRCVKKVSAS